MHNCFKETAETFLSSTGLKLPVDYTVDVDKRKGIYLQVNTESFLHYVLGCALLVILHVEVLFVCFDKFTAIFLWPNCLAYPNLLSLAKLPLDHYFELSSTLDYYFTTIWFPVFAPSSTEQHN
jgi:hypothetical protein